HRAAYLITRLPATYAVLSSVLREVKLRIGGLRVENMLDLGSGPGTAMWIAAEHFPELAHVTLVDDSAEWIDAGKRLASKSETRSIRCADWRHGSVSDPLPSGAFDLVTLSYVLNELRPAERSALVRSAWSRTGKLLIVTE